MQPLPPPVWLSWLKETIRIPAVFGTVIGAVAGIISLLAGCSIQWSGLIATVAGLVANILAHHLWPH